MKNNNEKKELLEKNKKIELEPCRNAPHAEMARNQDKDEPCDDSRG